MPESYLVSPTGIVVEKIVGGVTKADLDALIARNSAPPPSDDGAGGGS